MEKSISVESSVVDGNVMTSLLPGLRMYVDTVDMRDVLLGGAAVWAGTTFEDKLMCPNSDATESSSGPSAVNMAL